MLCTSLQNKEEQLIQFYRKHFQEKIDPRTSAPQHSKNGIIYHSLHSICMNTFGMLHSL